MWLIACTTLRKTHFNTFFHFRLQQNILSNIKMSSFLDLPDELILKVLSYTNIVDLLICGQVSKRIRTISNDDSLFQTVNFSGKYVKIDFLEFVLNKGCKSVNLSDSYIWGNLSLIQKSQLRKLDIPYNCRAKLLYHSNGVLCWYVMKFGDPLPFWKNVQLTPKMVANVCQNNQSLKDHISKEGIRYEILPTANKWK